MTYKTAAKKRTSAKKPACRPTVGVRVIEGLEQAVAWTQGRTTGAKVTVLQVPRAGRPAKGETEDG
jgi:hypothetical protein